MSSIEQQEIQQQQRTNDPKSTFLNIRYVKLVCYYNSFFFFSLSSIICTRDFWYWNVCYEGEHLRQLHLHTHGHTQHMFCAYFIHCCGGRALAYEIIFTMKCDGISEKAIAISFFFSLLACIFNKEKQLVSVIFSLRTTYRAMQLHATATTAFSTLLDYLAPIRSIFHEFMRIRNRLYVWFFFLWSARG